MLKKKMRAASLCVIAGLLMTGCGSKEELSKYEVTMESYVKMTYDTVDVMSGDLTPAVDLDLSAVEQKTVDYHPAMDNMTVKTFNAERGDVVEQGQVLITFENEDLDERIAEYEAEVAEYQVLLSHIRKMIDIGSKEYTEDDIKMVQADLSVSNGYLEELKNKKEGYSIKAEGHGVIATVSNMLSYGFVGTTDSLISISYGDGCYYAETTDPFAFEVGKIYEAYSGSGTYKMKLVSILEPKDNPDSDKRKLMFEYQSVKGEIPIFDSLDMTIQKNVLKNVTYVPEEAVMHNDDGDFVSVVGEGGFGYKREVKVSSYIDGYAIIDEGVEMGEKVIIQ